MIGKERLQSLTGTNISLLFSSPQSIQEADAVEYLRTLSSKERPELLGKMYAEYMALSRILQSRKKGMIDD